jgi:hypothetical protein
MMFLLEIKFGVCYYENVIMLYNKIDGELK